MSNQKLFEYPIEIHTNHTSAYRFFLFYFCLPRASPGKKPNTMNFWVIRTRSSVSVFCSRPAKLEIFYLTLRGAYQSFILAIIKPSISNCKSLLPKQRKALILIVFVLVKKNMLPVSFAVENLQSWEKVNFFISAPELYIQKIPWKSVEMVKSYFLGMKLQHLTNHGDSNLAK